jgi:hypothetical protein
METKLNIGRTPFQSAGINLSTGFWKDMLYDKTK